MTADNINSLREFSTKDWKNFGIYIVLIGLLLIFVVKSYKIGIGFVLTGIIFLIIFHGPKSFKILKKSNW